MARERLTVEDFGINMPQIEFIDAMVDAFNTKFHGEMTIDELLLHPREAMLFCDEIRHSMKNWNIPDDFILRAILQRRKNP